MRIAAIDLGSNTFHLLIAEYNSSQIDIIYKTNKPVRLSENITQYNRIIPAAFERGKACLEEYKTIMDEFKVEKMHAVATSAIRSATNGQEFIEQVKLSTGIEIQIISGQEEASLIYEAVKVSGAIDGRTLIMDIGGGSTEFIFCDENKAYWKKSFDIGAARLMQKFWTNDPISNGELKTLHEYLDETLRELVEFNKGFKARTLVGSAGAFETFLEMSDSSISSTNLKSATLNINQYKKLSEKLKLSTHEERTHMPNLIPLRVDMIVMACVLTDYILNELKIQDLRMTTYDLKYGVLHKIVN
ncbi:Ppx/GppA phosphatase family protein [Sphingobacterium bovisgrunnientis]|jgi:exopolyphosphatase/guanosine-5'-triphosphate,3'-diphosphate pyrophosphatase|uniref:Ppx/GppA phosphatase family protein n=1 Tax=Sphingobacterium bovisgrunnientis TaxID=1874697 RepID=UPI00135939C9|nr:Ppx/GppA phosphatase family protein [Sphingobacterium bovisgrunnientis]